MKATRKMKSGQQALAKTPNTLYVKAYHQGRISVLSVDLRDPELELKLVYSHPKYDVYGDLLFSKTSGRAVGIQIDVDNSFVYWDDEYKVLQNDIDLSLPATNNDIYDLSDDGNRYLVFASSDTDPGTYYIGDRSSGEAKVVARSYSAINPAAMASKTKFTYDARDGQKIEGFLTLPNDDSGKPRPAIVFPHRGPHRANDVGFDYWVQYFTSRGYAVLQMNFRGSSGYGYEFEAAGMQAWGLEMQDDVEDGTRWLIDEGVADPERICIVGAGYGGYVALMEATPQSGYVPLRCQFRWYYGPGPVRTDSPSLHLISAV